MPFAHSGAMAVLLALVFGASRHVLADGGTEDEHGFLAPRRLTNNGAGDQNVWWKSCWDPEGSQTSIPWEISNHGNHYGIALECTYSVSWEMSPTVLQLIQANGADPNEFTFKVCWADKIDKNFRWWPWLHTNSADWRFDLAGLGSTLITPQNLAAVWRKGYMNLMPDALDYFARMGQVLDRKIIPKFLVYGWSKGATYNWHIGRWRPDLIQASVLVNGCNGKNYWGKPSGNKKAIADGLAPHLFFSSPMDTFLKCSHDATKKQVQSNRKHSQYIYHEEIPCGHHPTKCASHCPRPLEEIFNHPFWDFVHFSYSHANCEQWNTETECGDALCQWDSELSYCGEKHATSMNPSCEKFCSLEEVPSCGDVDLSNCTSSYAVLPIDQADADGMHSKCEVSGGQCVQAAQQFQCFFQDQCP